MQEHLSKTLAFRVTESEASVILAAAEELQVTPSVYLRSLFCANADRGPRLIHPICRVQWVQLSRLSSNLNQIAHVLNSGESVDYSDLLAGIEQTLTELKAVRAHLAGGAR